MSDLPNVSNDSIVQFQIAWERISASIGRDTAIRRNLIKQARENGIDTEMATLAIRTKKRWSSTEATERLSNLLRSMALVHMPVAQDDLFNWSSNVTSNTAAAADAWEAERSGYEAGSHGADPADCRYDAGTEAHALWNTAYRRGQDDHAEHSGGTERVPAERTRRARGRAEEDTVEPAPAPRRRRRGNGRAGATAAGV